MKKTTIGSPLGADVYFVEEPTYVMYSHIERRIYLGSPSELLNKADSTPSVVFSTEESLVSGNKKFLIVIEDAFYHIFLDNFITILRVLEKNPMTEFVIFVPDSEAFKYLDTIKKFVPQFMDSIGAQYSILEYGSNMSVDGRNCGAPISPAVLMSNFSYLNRFDWEVSNNEEVNYEPSLADVVKLSTALRGILVRTKEVKPSRKVYLSRRKVKVLESVTAKDFPGFQDDIRVDDEDKMEAYFLSKGFEVVFPEDFTSFLDQLNYMQETSVLASLSGSGLVNSCLMLPGQTVIELQVETVVLQDLNNPEQGLVLDYSGLTFAMGHTYIAVPSPRNADVLIEKLEALGSI